MKSFSFLLLVSFLVLSLTGPIARAENCEATRSVATIRIFKGTGAERRSPTLKEVFDAMNAKGSTLFKDLQNPEGDMDLPRTFVEVSDLKQPGFMVDFKTLPSPKVGDRACKNKKQTGYECREEQLRATPGTDKLKKGLDTGVKIHIPTEDRSLIKRITTALGCDELLYENGQPVLAAPGSGKHHAPPAEKTATKP